ncbi:MAG: class I tRNA ligase family protein [Patescibacteria group bacterium]
MNKDAKYDPAKIEKKWQKKWTKDKLYQSKEDPKKEKFFVLDMFPYPSGEGLHVGHPKGYIATDIISRFQRMHGKSVLHPMGFDAFGLPAENYAIKMKKNPMDLTEVNVNRFKEQLEIIGLDYDWSREVNTTDPAYYTWTQWIFLQLYKKGLAYESFEPINWCPVDKTGLANEDVVDGRCERCGTLVEKRPMRQWVLKITDYADRLLQDLDMVRAPVFTNTVGSDAFRKDMPVSERHVVHCLIKHWSEDKYLCMKWKKNDWRGFVIGGIEDGESAETTAIREVMEETGYKNVVFKKIVGTMTAEFYQQIKKENRRAFITTVYLELQNGEQSDVPQHEKDIQDMEWVPAAQVRDFVNRDDLKYEWDVFTGAVKQAPLLDWPASIKEAQRNWIGKSEGAEIEFTLKLANNKPRFVLIHGYKESPQEGYLPWLKKELEKRGHEVQVPELPNPANPKESEQVDYVINNCTIDENTVIVAHSLGGVVAQKVIMKLNKQISGLVLVGNAITPGFSKDTKSRPFHKNFTWDFDYARINKLAQGRVAVLSDTKEIHRSAFLKDLATKLSAAFIEVDAVKEHFNGSEEPAVLKCVTPTVSVFTTRPDTIFGVTYIVLAPEHPWVSELLPQLENGSEVEAYVAQAKLATEIERTDAKKEKTGVELKGIKATNPANGEEVPVWIADYVLADYGTGVVMAVPAHDERDFAFAKKFGLGVKQVVAPLITRTGDEDAWRAHEPEAKRPTVVCIVKHWSDDKYLFIKKKILDKAVVAIAGGIDGEDTVQAGQREIREESGYLNTKFVRDLGTPVYYRFYSITGKQNRISELRPLYFELVDGEREEMSENEKQQHEELWLSKEEIDQYLKGRLFNPIFWNRLNNSQEAFTEAGIVINSGKFDGKASDSVKKDITLSVGGQWVSKYKLRDWVFSRQRYWGEPIPLIHCKKCGVVAVPEKDLPVKLPKVKSYEPTGTGESPLADIHKWVNVKCPKCKSPAKRETNTMPQWAGSSWYYLRYMDPKNKNTLVDPKKEKYWAPVDMYVGGAEHATRHLIYARFWHKFLYDIGTVSTTEPFIKLQHVGLIMGEDGRKMSKRFGNVVNPDDIVKAYGADTLRLYEMFMGPFDQQIAWSTSSMVGPRRFIEKVWRLREKVIDLKMKSASSSPEADRVLHKTIKKVTVDINALSFNTAVSTLMISVNELEKATSLTRDQFEILLKLLAPFAPHVAEELWYSVGNKTSVHISSWPVYNEALVVDSEVQIIVQVNGKVRASFKAETGSTEAQLEAHAKEIPEVKKWIEGKGIKKVIVVKGKLVSIVVA